MSLLYVCYQLSDMQLLRIQISPLWDIKIWSLKLTSSKSCWPQQLFSCELPHFVLPICLTKHV